MFFALSRVETYLTEFDLFFLIPFVSLGSFALCDVSLNVHMKKIPESKMGNERRSDLLHYIEKNLLKIKNMLPSLNTPTDKTQLINSCYIYDCSH